MPKPVLRPLREGNCVFLFGKPALTQQVLAALAEKADINRGLESQPYLRYEAPPQIELPTLETVRKKTAVAASEQPVSHGRYGALSREENITRLPASWEVEGLKLLAIPGLRMRRASLRQRDTAAKAKVTPKLALVASTDVIHPRPRLVAGTDVFPLEPKAPMLARPAIFTLAEAWWEWWLSCFGLSTSKKRLPLTVVPLVVRRQTTSEPE